ncbi:MAG TPA: DUF4139 domain-containing protein [Armatimonadota bacterium]|jgi:hypothetical protein
MKRWGLVGLLLMVAVGRAPAVVEMSAALDRQDAALTIYNPQITLVEERRVVSLAKGSNRINFTWAGAGIDPSSIYMESLKPQRVWEVSDIVFPNAGNLLTWEVASKESWSGEVRILYFLSGFSWRSEYICFADTDEKTLALKSSANIGNQSGETFRDSEVRLVVGSPHLLSGGRGIMGAQNAVAADAILAKGDGDGSFSREGFSEYSIFNLKGRATLELNQNKQIPLLEADKVGITKTYTWDPRSFGNQVAMHYEFKNTQDNGLGAGLPEGRVRVFRRTEGGGMALVGEDMLPFVPRGETAKLFLGSANNVVVERTLVDSRRENVVEAPDRSRVISFDQILDIKIVIRNRKAGEVELRLFDPSAPGEVVQSSHEYKREDANTLKFVVKVPSDKEITITYRLKQKVIQ